MTRKTRASIKAVLTVLDKCTDWMLLPSKSETLRRLRRLADNPPDFAQEFDKFYRGSVQEGINRLQRKGKVEVRETGGGTEVRISDKGRTEVLKYKLEEMIINIPQKWDGKWRVVVFDVQEIERSKRDMFRDYLVKIGFKPLQRSVFVCPYPCGKEIAFLREVVGVPHGVKFMVVEKMDNDEDLQMLFEVG
ncbi:MAG: Transcriptional regulator, PaaX family [Candidatus Amesbacteria bacterium GW2011_GWA2_42_12]|uniref:Transcriptional regulator, PaaX family n=1 Tax=Candidatus Amesbacteria bacterium GW2011_GWA2_42_12 TaxID=1618356 RepID=A0A0G1AE84_9BACT|nr:MAG: Transcriptional regulator, PaaX family [Candidatus Amesbacteria bacterium GW2011_GWA2_42_12]